MKSEYYPTMGEYRFVLDGEVFHLRDKWLDEMWNKAFTRDEWGSVSDFALDVAWFKFGYTENQKTLL